MDLSRFDTREKASQGVTFDLVIDGETIHGDDDKPITFTVKGIADREVQAFLMKASKKNNLTPDDADEEDMKLARMAVVGWSDNFEAHGEKLPYSKDNIAKVLASPPVRRYVLSRITDEHRFMNGS